MTKPFAVITIGEYLALPELEINAVSDARVPGSIYEVHKVGFYAANEAECLKNNIEADKISEMGKCPLPTIVVTAEKEKKLFRLPPSLASWAVDTVAPAHAGLKPFPCRVGFGIFQDRHFAEII
jgi:hypothetical protein